MYYYILFDNAYLNSPRILDIGNYDNSCTYNPPAYLKSSSRNNRIPYSCNKLCKIIKLSIGFHNKFLLQRIYDIPVDIFVKKSKSIFSCRAF